MNPSGCFAQSGTNFLGFALQQKDLTGSRGNLWHHAFYAAAGLEAHINAPFLHEGLDILTGRWAAVDQIFADVETDSTGANDCNARTDRRTRYYIKVAQNLGMIYAGNVGAARDNASGQDDFIEFGQRFCRDPLVQFQCHPTELNFLAEIAQSFIKLFFSRYLLGNIKLPTNLVCSFK